MTVTPYRFITFYGLLVMTATCFGMTSESPADHERTNGLVSTLIRAWCREQAPWTSWTNRSPRSLAAMNYHSRSSTRCRSWRGSSKNFERGKLPCVGLLAAACGSRYPPTLEHMKAGTSERGKLGVRLNHLSTLLRAGLRYVT